MINDYLQCLCRVLQVDLPTLKTDDVLLTPTMIAYLDPGTNVLHVKRNVSDQRDTFFAVAHELRHAWQAKYAPDLYLTDYHPVTSSGDRVAYNLQPAEIDANAFASVIMTKLFRARPLFDGMPDEVITAIEKRSATLLDEIRL